MTNTLPGSRFALAFFCARLPSFCIALICMLALAPADLRAATLVVTNTADSGAGSLRQAILDANATNGVDTIAFAIPGAGPHTIMPSSTMPIITDPVIIDGYTQAGSSSNTLATGNNAVLKIELNMINANGGLAISAGSSTVRGLVINRNNSGGAAGASIWLHTLGSNVVEGCFLGTDTTGLLDLGNAEGVIAVYPSGNNLIGGINPGARNVISGNGVYGVDLRSSSNSVQGNFIGVDRTGTNVMGNGYGVFVFMHPALGPITNSLNLIGGDVPGAANIISGNNGPGIVLSQDGPPLQTQIKGNFIGTDFTGTRDLGNQTDGITLTAFFNSGLAENVIGDTAPNVIAFNRGYGIQVGTAAANLIAGNVIYSNVQAGVNIPLYLGGNSNNTISANSIFNNAQLGITLRSDINALPNDPCDTDTGSNHLQNYPVLTNATSDASSVTIDGFLPSTASTDYMLEFFANTACDPKGSGEGEFFLGSTNVMTGANCTNNFTVTLPFPVPGGIFITATATDPFGNTSEFSACSQITGLVLPPGDVNGDRRVTGADSLLINQVLVGLRMSNDAIFTAATFANGDANQNNSVGGSDSLLINQVLVGLRAYATTKIVPGSRTNTTPVLATVFGIGIPTNTLSGVTIGPPVNLSATQLIPVSPFQIIALVPAGGGAGTGVVNAVATPTNGVISFGRFINQ